MRTPLRGALACLLFLTASFALTQDHTTGKFHGCKPEGSGTPGRFDPALDRLKNRDLPPDSFDDMAVSDFLDNVPIHAAAEGKKERAKWSQKSRDEVAPWEAKGARIEGYILKVLPEKGEACNCGSLTFHDFHMFLAEAKSDTREQAMVVEVSPRLLPGNPGWTPTALGALGTHKAKVRISGWITWDQEHPEQLVPAANRGPTRGTLWEIHPIHKIEVWTNGAWTDF